MKIAKDIIDIIKQSTTLIAVSGGVDSIVLLDVLRNSRVKIAVAYFDHSIREESIQDYILVSEYCSKHNITLHTRKMDVAKHCSDNKVSIELGARNLRYEFFNEVRNMFGYEYLALAHHAGDQIETMLYNMFRGSGVSGLAAMMMVDHDRKIIRPFLKTFKEDIYNYAIINELSWNEDSSNNDIEYDRNLIRNVILPTMEERRKGTKKVLLRTNEYFNQVDEFLVYSAKEWMEKNYNCGFWRKEFNKLPDLLKGEILRQIWIDFNGPTGFTSAVVREVSRWLSNNNGGGCVYFGKVHMSLNKGMVQIG